MMRWLFLVLLLSNALAFYLLNAPGLPEDGGARPAGHSPVHPERIRLVRTDVETPAARKEPAPAVAYEQVCLEWGGLASDESENLREVLRGLGLTESRIRQIDEPLGKSSQFWVFVPPFKTRPEAQKKLDEIKALGVNDAYIIQDGAKQRFTISLGVFSSREGAEKHLTGLRDKGVRSARHGPRGGDSGTVVFQLQSPGAEFEEALVKIKQAKYPESTIQAIPCGQ